MKTSREVKTKLPFEITLYILISIGFILLISAIFISISLNSFYEEQKVYIIDKFSKIFISLISQPLERYDYYAVEKSCQEFLGEEIINYIYVYDINGFLVNQSFSEKIMKPSKYVFEIILEIKNNRNEKIGETKIGYDFQNLYKSILKIKIIVFINIVLIIVFITISVFIIISKKLTSPLFELLNSINKITSGQYDHVLKIKSNDEIGEISSAFNIMTSKLNSTISLINNIVQNLPSAIIFIDKQFKINLWNKKAEELFFINSNEVFDKLIYDVDPYFIELETDFLEIFNSGKIKVINQKPIQFDKFKGQFHTISLIPLKAKNEIIQVEGMIIKIDDETENVKRINMITQMQKMESIQILGSGIAHDFNNILGSIKGTISLLDDDIRNKNIDLKEFENYLDILKLSTQKATLVVNQLMTLAKKRDSNFSVIKVNESVGDVIKICEHSFDKCVEIEYFNNIGDCLIWGIEAQIEQALLNICINAYHAMTCMRKEDEKKGGKLIISLNKIEKNNIKYCKISVKDNGVGIPKENIGKIFDPFFSTKDKSTSSGLGLALVYNIIENHKGFIEVDSEINVGTEFNLFIPLLEEKENYYIEKEKEKENLLSNFSGKKALIVEDDEILRKVTVRMLEKFGFKVHELGDPSEFFNIYENLKNEINLIMLDLIMPKLSGYELFNILKEKYKIVEKNIPIIFATGLAQDERILKLSEYQNVHLLFKPYSMEDLNKILKNLFIEK